MGLKYTEEKLNSLDKETIIQLFLSQQEQLEGINQNLRLVLEQMADLKGTVLAGRRSAMRQKARFPLWRWMGRLCSSMKRRQS